MFWKKNNCEREKELNRIVDLIASQNLRILEIENKINLIQLSPTAQFQDRLAEIEVKTAKLWSLLTEKTDRGKDRLSKYGRMFGGKANL